jgi:hypothetical protein
LVRPWDTPIPMSIKYLHYDREFCDDNTKFKKTKQINHAIIHYKIEEYEYRIDIISGFIGYRILAGYTNNGGEDDGCECKYGNKVKFIHDAYFTVFVVMEDLVFQYYYEKCKYFIIPILKEIIKPYEDNREIIIYYNINGTDYVTTSMDLHGDFDYTPLKKFNDDMTNESFLYPVIDKKINMGYNFNFNETLINYCKGRIRHFFIRRKEFKIRDAYKFNLKYNKQAHLEFEAKYKFKSSDSDNIIKEIEKIENPTEERVKRVLHNILDPSFNYNEYLDELIDYYYRNYLSVSHQDDEPDIDMCFTMEDPENWFYIDYLNGKLINCADENV